MESESQVHGHKQIKTILVNADIWCEHKGHTVHYISAGSVKQNFLNFLMEDLLVLVQSYVPVEAKMQGELCEDEVFSQQAVGLCSLHRLLRGHRDQTGFLVETWYKTLGII